MAGWVGNSILLAFCPPADVALFGLCNSSGK